MTDKPILFSAPMVQAILREIREPGTGKTQTRRLPIISGHKSYSEFGRSDTNGYDWTFRDTGMRWHDLRHDELLSRLQYQDGDHLWVRETWTASQVHDAKAPSAIKVGSPIGYEADQSQTIMAPGKLRPSIFMPRWASRITLEVTRVRVQLLQEISQADAWAEGCKRGDPHENGGYWPAEEKHPNVGWIGWDDARMWFSDIWDGIYPDPEKQWDANPWVVAVTFRPHLCNIDKMENAG